MGLGELHYRISLPVSRIGQRVIGSDDVSNLKPNEQYPEDPVSSRQRLPAPHNTSAGSKRSPITTSLRRPVVFVIHRSIRSLTFRCEATGSPPKKGKWRATRR